MIYMQQLKIKVNVANRVYPLTINRNDEEGVRKAVKNIANRLKIYEAKFEARDTQDLLSMCLLEMAIKLLGDEQKVKVDSSFEDQLLEIESYIDSNL
ncbi:cell division protein ZapA [Flavobacteriales bacterium]|nr:cell division protein ZapA [Flavobacteriales bacterium]|tara:strand:- start:76 stop:366 length:291 start_codon:yes stop_codon:yes gene_type:complete